MFLVGVTIPLVITTYKGFNLLHHQPCGIYDVVLETLNPATEYLRHDSLALKTLLATSSMLLDA